VKKMLLLLVFAACAFGEDAKQDPATARAIEGAKILLSSMRDPDRPSVDHSKREVQRCCLELL
jgi:hypothetical protein